MRFLIAILILSMSSVSDAQLFGRWRTRATSSARMYCANGTCSYVPAQVAQPVRVAAKPATSQQYETVQEKVPVQRMVYDSGRWWTAANCCGDPGCSMKARIQAKLNAHPGYELRTVRRPIRRAVAAPVRAVGRAVTAPVRAVRASRQQRAQKQQRKAVKPKHSSLDAAHQPLRADEIKRALAMLDLGYADVFADVGSGDGRILIAAVRKYGCRAVGIEIDASRMAAAKAAVAQAEKLSQIPRGHITLVTGDAADWDPQRYGITAAVAYLWPETLTQLRGTLTQIPKVAVPFHPLEGMTPDSESDGIYLYAQR